MKVFRLCMFLKLGTSLSKFAFGFAPSSSSSRAVLSAARVAASTRTMTAPATRTKSASASSSSTTAMYGEKLSIAILGGGIAGLSCASRLLSQHKKTYDAYSSTSYELEVTVFDTGRLRPGGRCSSRLPGDKPAAVKNGGGGGGRNNRRACDDDGNSNDNNPAGKQVPQNIQKALDGAAPNDNSSRDRIVNGMGPVDHAAQIISIPNVDSSFDEFQTQLDTWLKEGIVESFPKDSVCELFKESDDKEAVSKLEPLNGEMYYGKGGMGNIPIAMREYCLSFNQFGDNYTGQSFRILQDVWVSPSNGVQYIGDKDNIDLSQPQWELRAGKKSLGKYHRLVIGHNGKCADRIMSRSPAKAFHSLLRTKFAPYVPQNGGREMTLNSIYSLAFAVKSDKDDDGGGGGAISKALSKLSSNEKGVYTVMIKNEPTLRLLSCNTLKHHHHQNRNSNTNVQVYTLLSSPMFGKQFKGPQENLPPDLMEKVVMKMLGNLEGSLNVKEGSVTDTVVDLKLQLWGAGVPMNTWESRSIANSGGSGGADGFVYDATYGVGACGDWILDPSIAGAWESGRRLASWMLLDEGLKSVGLPDRSAKSDEGGKFVPSRVALESGIGTIPSSPNSSGFKFPPPNEQNDSSRNPRGRGNGGGRGRGRGRGRGGGRGRGRGRGEDRGRGRGPNTAEGSKRTGNNKDKKILYSFTSD